MPQHPLAYASLLPLTSLLMPQNTLTITRPDDWHVHLRDGDALVDTVPAMSRYFGRAIVMPNLLPPAVTPEQAGAYRERILAARPTGSRFEPLMVLYLTEGTTVDDIRRAKASGFVHAVKLYPAGATTNSQSGVTDLSKVDAVLNEMADCGMPLLIHGEVTHSEIDIFDHCTSLIIQPQSHAGRRHSPALLLLTDTQTQPPPSCAYSGCNQWQSEILFRH